MFEGINYDKLDQSINIDNKEKMKAEIESVINQGRDEQSQIALDIVENLDKEQLATYIESSFKHPDGWDTYQTMKLNPYYGFMVQAALDFLSDKFEDKKFDSDGNESANGKSIDEWISIGGGIDNKIGGKTQSAVRIAQKLLDINVDGYAGPQFFAKICSVLRNQSNPTDFVVRENPNYSYNFNGRSKSINIGGVKTDSEQLSNIEFNFSSDISDLVQQDNGDIQIFMGGVYSGCYLKKNGNSFNIEYVQGYDKNERGEFILNNSDNFITYRGPSQIDLGSDNAGLSGDMIEGISNDDFDKLKDIFVGDSDNGSLRFVMRNKDGSIKKGSNGNIIVYSVQNNNDFYYVRNGTYIGNGKLLNGSRTRYDSGLYKLVRKNLDCGQFSSLFSSGYENLMDEKSQEILNKDGNDRTLSDLRYLGGKFSTWTNPIHLQQLGARLTRSSENLSGGKNFLDWCKKMKESGISTKKLTLRNRFALSTMGCDSPSDFIEEGWFQKKYNNKE